MRRDCSLGNSLQGDSLLGRVVDSWVPETGAWPVITRVESPSVYRCSRPAIECSGRITVLGHWTGIPQSGGVIGPKSRSGKLTPLYGRQFAQNGSRRRPGT